MGRRFRIDGKVYLSWALGLLILPPEWAGALFLGILVHEFCHFGMAKILGVRVSGVRWEMGGCRMDTEPMDPKEEAMVALAGPVGSFCLLGLMRYYPALGICGGLQGVWNLLPIYPRDGGRVLRCLAGEAVYTSVSFVANLALLIVGTIASYQLKSLWILLLMLWKWAGRTGHMKNTLQSG